jgi:hypothetical protein
MILSWRYDLQRRKLIREEESRFTDSLQEFRDKTPMDWDPVVESLDSIRLGDYPTPAVPIQEGKPPEPPGEPPGGQETSSGYVFHFRGGTSGGKRKKVRAETTPSRGALNQRWSEENFKPRDVMQSDTVRLGRKPAIPIQGAVTPENYKAAVREAYEPPDGVRETLWAILKNVKGIKTLHDPFVGFPEQGGLNEKFWKAKGCFEVTSKPGVDFFSDEGWEACKAADVLVSSPPFSIRSKVFQKLKYHDRWAMFVPIDTLTYQYFEDTEVQVMVINQGIRFFRNGKRMPGESPQRCAWVCKGLGLGTPLSYWRLGGIPHGEPLLDEGLRPHTWDTEAPEQQFQEELGTEAPEPQVLEGKHLSFRKGWVTKEQLLTLDFKSDEGVFFAPHPYCFFSTGVRVVKALVDTGGCISMVHPKFLHQFEGKIKTLEKPISIHGVGDGNGPLICSRYIHLIMQFGDEQRYQSAIIPDSSEVNLPPLLLGGDWIYRHRVILDLGGAKFCFKTSEDLMWRDLEVVSPPPNLPEPIVIKLPKTSAEADNPETKSPADTELGETKSPSDSESKEKNTDSEGSKTASTSNGTETKSPEDQDPVVVEILFTRKGKETIIPVPPSPRISSVLSTMLAQEKEKILEKAMSDAKPSLKEKFKAMLRQYNDVLCYTDDDLTPSLAGYHAIKTTDEKPIRCRPRRFSQAELAIIKEQMLIWIRTGVVERSFSEWGANITLAQKGDGSWRICVAYQELNSKTVKETYPMPMMEDMIEHLQGAEYITKIDLRAGFNQIYVEPDDRKKTSFFVPTMGKFEFNTMPFGLTGAPATFQRCMERVLRGDIPIGRQRFYDKDHKHRRNILYEYAMVYIDDLVIWSSGTEEDHVQKVQEVLDRLALWELKAKPQKCHFGCAEVEILGLIVSGKTIRTNPQRIDAILSIPRPRTLKQMRSFLGLANAFRRFIPNLADITYPLRRLLKSTHKWTGSKLDATYSVIPEGHTLSADQAFHLLKKKLTEPPVLHQPDKSKRFYLRTDASTFAAGAVLFQLDKDGNRCPIAFAARSFAKHELNWHINEKEAYAVVWAVQQWRHLLHGPEFTVECDSKVVTAVLGSKNFRADRLERWAMALLPYTFVMVPIKGAHNTVADILSRLKTEAEGGAANHKMQSNFTFSYAEEDKEAMRDLEIPMGLQDVFTTTGKTLKKNRHAMLPSMKEIAAAQVSTAFYKEMKKRYEKWTYEDLKNLRVQPVFTNEVLYFRDNIDFRNNDEEQWESLDSWESLRIWVPEGELRNRIVAVYHDADVYQHPGINRAVSRVTPFYYWQGIHADIAKYVKTCVLCQKAKTPRAARAGLLLEKPTLRPFDVISIDLKGPLPKTSGKNYTYVLSILDSFSRLYIPVPLENKKQETVANALWENYLSRFPAPNTIISDNGKEFTNRLVRKILREHKIEPEYVSPYHPSAVHTERIHRVLNASLKIYAKKFGHNRWDRVLPLFASAYNNTPLTSIGLSPMEIVFAKKTVHPESLNNPGSLKLPSNLEEYLKDLPEWRSQMYDYVQHMNQKLFQKNKDLHDRSHYMVDYQVGDKVWVWRDTKTDDKLPAKFKFPWVGPCTVKKKLTENSYELEMPNNKIQKQHVTNMAPARLKDLQGQVEVDDNHDIDADEHKHDDTNEGQESDDDADRISLPMLSRSIENNRIVLVLDPEDSGEKVWYIAKVIDDEWDSDEDGTLRYLIQYYNTHQFGFSLHEKTKKWYPVWIDEGNDLVYRNKQPANSEEYTDIVKQSNIVYCFSTEEESNFLKTAVLPDSVVKWVRKHLPNTQCSWKERRAQNMITANSIWNLWAEADARLVSWHIDSWKEQAYWAHTTEKMYANNVISFMRLSLDHQEDLRFRAKKNKRIEKEDRRKSHNPPPKAVRRRKRAMALHILGSEWDFTCRMRTDPQVDNGCETFRSPIWSKCRKARNDAVIYHSKIGYMLDSYIEACQQRWQPPIVAEEDGLD